MKLLMRVELGFGRLEVREYAAITIIGTLDPTKRITAWQSCWCHRQRQSWGFAFYGTALSVCESSPNLQSCTAGPVEFRVF